MCKEMKETFQLTAAHSLVREKDLNCKFSLLLSNTVICVSSGIGEPKEKGS